MEARIRTALAVALALAPLPAAAGEETTPSALVAAIRSEDASRRHAALAEVVRRARSLPSSAEPPVREAAAAALAGSPDPATRALAATALGRLGGAAAAPPLLASLEIEEHPSPQAAAVEALAELPPGAVAAPLSRLAFSGPTPGARALAAEALGRVPGDAPLRTLLVLRETTLPWPAAAATLLALGLRDDPRAVDAVLPALADPDPALRAAAREAAEALLGGDLGPDPAAWRERWAAAREGWRRGTGAMPAPPAADGVAEVVTDPVAPVPPGRRSTARFYDIPVAGARVAFVLDCSASMACGLADAARAELAAAVKGLRSGQRFGVVLFHERAWRWREDLVPARPAQKWLLVRDLPDLPAKSYTNIHEALDRAFGWSGEGRFPVPGAPGLDEVFLLSDGLPNRGRLQDPDALVAFAAGWAGRHRARLHGVALGERAGDLLARMAAAAGGECVRR